MPMPRSCSCAALAVSACAVRVYPRSDDPSCAPISGAFNYVTELTIAVFELTDIDSCVTFVSSQKEFSLIDVGKVYGYI